MRGGVPIGADRDPRDVLIPQTCSKSWLVFGRGLASVPIYIRVLPLILSASRFARDQNLARFQAVNSPDGPLNEMPEGEQEKVLE